MTLPATAPTALSPSRASDFKTCPLLYRFRAIDRLPEPLTLAQVKGTLVHAVLEQLFALDTAQRTPGMAKSLLPHQWDRLQDEEPRARDLFASPDGLKTWLDEASNLVESYFEVENPALLHGDAEREVLIETTIAGDVPIRGYIDRVDIAPTGEVRVVDYKTGKAPKPAYTAQALFQLKFYALAWWRTRGVVPKMLRLVYLKDSQIIDYSPSESELLGVERTVTALWKVMSDAIASGEFPARKNPLCGWCAHQSHCPEFGGTPPAYPLHAAL